jgi:ABC-type glycerol-3-phosphate transport system substrate-binding protein
MRKITLLLFAVSFLLLTGCGKNDGRTLVTYYGRPNEKGFETMVIAEFEKRNPDIKINYVELPENTDQKLKTINTILMARDSSMDVFIGDVVWTPLFVGAGWALELDDYISDEEMAGFTPGSADAYEYMGHKYGIPFFMDGGMLFYRDDLLQKYNRKVPKTWDELIKTAQDIMNAEGNPNLYGYAGSWRNFEGLTCNLVEFIWSNGGEVFDDNNNVVFNSPESVAGMKIMGDMKNVYKITPPGITNFGSGDIRSLFLNGQLIFSRDWPSFAKFAYDPKLSDLAGKIKYTMLPHGKGYKSYSALGGWGLMVSKFSKHPEEAIRFIKFRAGREVQKQEAIILNHFPAIIDLYEDKDVQSALPFAKEMLPIMLATRPRPKTPFYSKVSAILQSQTQNVLNKEKTAKTAVRDAAEQIKETIE